MKPGSTGFAASLAVMLVACGAKPPIGTTDGAAVASATPSAPPAVDVSKLSFKLPHTLWAPEDTNAYLGGLEVHADGQLTVRVGSEFVRLDATGKELWRYRSTLDEIGDVLATREGGLLLFEKFSYTARHPPIVVKLDRSGAVAWEVELDAKLFRPVKLAHAYDAVEDTTVVALVGGDSNAYQMTLMTLGADGAVRWSLATTTEAVGSGVGTDFDFAARGGFVFVDGWLEVDDKVTPPKVRRISDIRPKLWTGGSGRDVPIVHGEGPDEEIAWAPEEVVTRLDGKNVVFVSKYRLYTGDARTDVERSGLRAWAVTPSGELAWAFAAPHVMTREKIGSVAVCGGVVYLASTYLPEVIRNTVPVHTSALLRAVPATRQWEAVFDEDVGGADYLNSVACHASGALVVAGKFKSESDPKKTFAALRVVDPSKLPWHPAE